MIKSIKLKTSKITPFHPVDRKESWEFYEDEYEKTGTFEKKIIVASGLRYENIIVDGNHLFCSAKKLELTEIECFHINRGEDLDHLITKYPSHYCKAASDVKHNLADMLFLFEENEKKDISKLNSSELDEFLEYRKRVAMALNYYEYQATVVAWYEDIEYMNKYPDGPIIGLMDEHDFMRSNHPKGRNNIAMKD